MRAFSLTNQNFCIPDSTPQTSADCGFVMRRFWSYGVTPWGSCIAQHNWFESSNLMACRLNERHDAECVAESCSRELNPGPNSSMVPTLSVPLLLLVLRLGRPVDSLSDCPDWITHIAHGSDPVQSPKCLWFRIGSHRHIQKHRKATGTCNGTLSISK